MSLRKITTLLLLAAFALTQVPVQAATLTGAATLPSAIVDAGTTANGANRDVVPVTVSINTTTASEVIFGTYTTTGTFAITSNGQLTTGGATLAPATSTKVFVLEPPVGSSFVGLAGYVENVTTAVMDPAAGPNTGSLVNVTSSNLPGTGNEDTAILAKIITEEGPASSFGGSTVRAGSIVVYTITNSATNTSTGESDISFQNIGLAIDAGSTISSASAVYRETIDGLILNESVPSLSNGDTLGLATVGTDVNGQISVALDSAEPDAQSNSVLADLLATAAVTVKVNTNNTTSTTVNQAILYVDTDALLIQAGPTPTGTPAFYNTPFNTSSFLNGVQNGGDIATLNAALTSATFPNSANALITVAYSLVPLIGNGATDATLVVDAASVSLMDQGGANDGYLGALAATPTDNGSVITANNFAVSVLYNGDSAAGTLPVVDFDLLGAATDVTATSTAVGFDFTATPEPLARTTATGTPFVNNGGNLVTGVFPGVDIATADDLSTTATVSNGNAITNVVNAAGFAGATIGENIWVQDEVTARLLPTGGNAIFAFTGNEAGAALTGATTKIGATNLATVPYNTAATVGSNAADDDVENNAILAANLTGNTVTIMPLVNKVDAQRDVIKVRPEATITLGTTSKAEGVRLIATVSGNNIAGSKVIEVARINAAGSTNVDAAVSSLPAAGTLNRLLAENGTDASTLRVPLDINTITNVTTNDEISDLVANGSVLDDTLPSLFCGGTAGTLTNGPNSVPQQPYARAILVQETTSGAFDTAFVGGGNDRIRFTLPVGVDLVKVDATASGNDVAVISTATGATPGAFTTAAMIMDYQTISEQNGNQAFIDVSYTAAQAGASTIKKAVALIFGQLSLVVPDGQADLDVTVTVVNDDGTSSTAADTVLDTLGTAPIADGCSEQFTIAYCDDALANFGIGSGPVESNAILNGSLLTSFSSTVSSGIRLINSDATAFRLPDICVTEASPDALFTGAQTTTPNIFGGGGAESISLAINDVSDTVANAGAGGAGGFGTDNIGFAGPGTILKSDDSVNFGAPGVGGSLINSTIAIGTGTDEFSETTTVRFTGVTLAKTNSNFLPSSQDITVFTNDGTNHIATTLPAAFERRGSNGTALVTTTANATDTLETFFNGDNIDSAAGAVDPLSGFFNNGTFLTTAFGNTDSAILSNASKTINDTASVFDQLSDTTKLSIAVDAIPAVTNGLAAFTRLTVFTSGGDLEPGSMINVTSSSGDFVNVPVTDDGNFIAQIRGEQGDTLVLTQTPGSDQATPTGSDQVVVVEAENQNLEPTLLSAVAQNFASIGTITEQGTAPVLFKLTTVGRLDGDVFMPTAAQLTVGDNPVYAVPGTDDMFLSIIDFRKTNGNTVIANVTGSPSVSITALDSDFPTFAKRSRPRLAIVRQRTKKNGDTRVVFKGRKLRNAGVGFVISDDGAVQEVTFRKRTRNDRSKNRVVSESTATLPTGALFGVYHVPGRGITTVDLSN